MSVEAADSAAATALREMRSLQQVYSLAIAALRTEILDEVPGAAP